MSVGMVRVPLGTPGEPRVPPQNADTAKQLTVTQQSQEEVARVKEQLAFQVEQVKREAEMKVSSGSFPASTEPSPAWEKQWLGTVWVQGEGVVVDVRP